MITENNIENLKIIVENLAFNDYQQAYKKSNCYLKGKYTPKGKERKFEGYSLSEETEKAHELYKLSLKSEITIDEEEAIKGYLLKIKMLDSHLLTPKYFYLK